MVREAVSLFGLPGMGAFFLNGKMRTVSRFVGRLLRVCSGSSDSALLVRKGKFERRFEIRYDGR